MNLAEQFDHAVLVVLVNGIEALKGERDIEIFVIHKAYLRRAIQALLAADVIDKVQGDTLTQHVATAWQPQGQQVESSLERTVNGEQKLAFLHAQGFMLLIADAASQFLCEQALGRAQRYFQSLQQCGLITGRAHQALNHQALTQVDHWSHPLGRL